MSEIIRVWLQNRLGLLFADQTWDEDKGGGILAHLLNSYSLITDEQLQIILSQTSDIYEPTLEVMRLIITNLGIVLSKDDFRDVLNAKGTATTKLFYELFIVLQGRSNTNFILSRKFNEAQKSSRFEVQTYDENTEVSEEIEIEKFSNPLAEGLHHKEEIIKYHINKYLELMQTCRRSREEYMMFLENSKKSKDKKPPGPSLPCVPETEFDLRELPTDAESLNQSMTELIKETKNAQKIQKIVPDKAVSMKIIASLQDRKQKLNQNRERRETFQNEILKDLWDELMDEQEHYFKHQFTEKLQQQSLYEQKMTTCLLHVRDHQKEIADQKKELMAEVLKQKSEDLENALFEEDEEKNRERFKHYKDLDKKLILHKRLYQQKQRRAQGKTGAECEEIMKDILDMAFYHVDFKEINCDEVPRRKRDDLARLFVAQQPIMDLLQDVTDVIQSEEYTSSDNITQGDDLENIAMLELDRQNAMDDLIFDDYHSFKWPWDYNSWMEFPEYTEMSLGMNVLAHVVYRLLLGKYPRKPMMVQTGVPRKEVAVCVNGFYKMEFLPVLKELLHGRNILVFEMKDVFEYCLDAYKKESSEEDINKVFEAQIEDPPEDDLVKKSPKLPKKGSKKIPENKSRKSAIEEPPPVTDVTTFEDKTIQTPEVFPDEKVAFTATAAIGKMLFETMAVGGLPNEYQSGAALVEYLNSYHPDEFDGWALINYPQTLQQAIALEEALSGTQYAKDLGPIPEDGMDSIVALGPTSDGDSMGLKCKRKSNLLDRPQAEISVDIEMDTFLTGFIQMSSKSENAEPDELLSNAFKSVENMDALSQYYQDQGCKYNLYYDQVSFPTIKQLGKLILGDYSLPPKDSEALFTDTIHYVEANFENLLGDTAPSFEKEGEKKVKKETKNKKETKASKKNESTTDQKTPKEKKNKKAEKASKPDKPEKDKKGKKDKKDKKEKEAKRDSESQPAIEMEDEETQIPTPVPEPEESIQEELPPVMAGDFYWTYHDLPLMPYYEDALATLWENLETIYITDMKQLFFRRRIIMDALMPYNTFVRNNMLEFIARPDDKQKHLAEFQLVFNEFEDDMREDEEVKAELHLRIEEFREKLWKICDARMLENEAERVRIIQEKWITTQLMELCNVYSTFAQLEIDRSTDTCQLLLDYYWAMMTGSPCKSTMEKIQLELIPLPKTIEDMDHVAPFLEFVENIMKSTITSSKESTETNDNPFVNKLKVNLKIATGKIDGNLKYCEDSGDQLQVRFHPNEAKAKAKAKNKNSASVIDTHIEDPEADAKQNAQQLFEELSTAYCGEHIRCNLRLNILEHTFEEEVQDMLDKSRSCFQGIYSLIERRYRGEVHAVDQAARLLNRAVEEETAIQPEMILQDDMFYIKLGSLMYESALPDADDGDLPVREPQDDEIFTISQLERIVDVLARLAPSAIIPERAFAFLLQEFIVYQTADGLEDYIPKAWKELPPYKVQKLMLSVFGETEYLDWRDFILYAMHVSFPSEGELLEIRSQFKELDPDLTEMIEEHQFPLIKFWFEKNVPPLRLQAIRKLLFRLYSIKSQLNYTALLLAFCKDEDPVVGVVKALELSLGKRVIYDEQSGSAMYMKGLKSIMAKELDSITKNRERLDIENMSKDIIEKMIDETVHRADSVALTLIDDGLQPLCSYDVIQYLNDPPRTSFGTATDSGTTSENEYHGDSFTNSGSQGYDSKDAVEYQVGFDVVMNVFTVMLPWLHRSKSFGEMTFHERFAMLYNSLINEDIRLAFVYQIFLDDDFLRMVQSFYRFYDRRLVQIVRDLLASD